METKQNTIHAGICMAGAVSAGAYTAGVIDYLLEALDHWEQAKALNLPDIPKHNFVIEVLGGASAGGMTAAITAAAVQADFPHINQEDVKDEGKKKENPLYNSWVNLTEKDNRDMMDIMLSTDDIENNPANNKHKEVRAGFNSSFIAEVADSIIDKAVKNGNHTRSYIAADADIFTTITNLRGYHFDVTFNTSQGQRKHKMTMHRDYAFFQLTDDGTYNKNGRIPLNFNKPEGLNKKVLKQAAMATGAFPVGLESRELERDSQYILDNRYLNLKLSSVHTNSVKYDFLAPGPFLSLNVDGGMINNEPFEITQQLLEERRMNGTAKADEALSPKTDATNFDTLVLMVDPFPSDGGETNEGFTVKKAWKNALPAILSAMRGQLLLKDDQIRKAYLSDDYSRFLISPTRSLNGEEQKFALACGALGGFGGFFSKKFREHDFYLGRRNCQRLLQKYFSVPVEANNIVLKNGYKGIEKQYIFSDKDTSGNEIFYLPIIPDMRVIKNATGEYSIVKPIEEKEYPFPQVNLSYLLSLEKKFEKRFKCILDNIKNAIEEEQKQKPQAIDELISKIRKKSALRRFIDKAVATPLTNAYLSIGKSSAKGMAARFFVDAVIKDMHKRSLLKDDS